MKILIEESTLRQALDAFDRQPYTMDKEVCESLRALRTAIDAAEKVEPVLCVSSKELRRLTAADSYIKAWLPPTTSAEDVALYTNPASAVPEVGK